MRNLAAWLAGGANIVSPVAVRTGDKGLAIRARMGRRMNFRMAPLAVGCFFDLVITPGSCLHRGMGLTIILRRLMTLNTVQRTATCLAMYRTVQDGRIYLHRQVLIGRKYDFPLAIIMTEQASLIGKRVRSSLCTLPNEARIGG